MTAPAWRMPAEHEPHERTWMAYPSAGYSLGDTETEHHEARTAWASVANAIVDHEPVSVVVDPDQTQYARKYLSSSVDIVEAPLNDAWMRDIGPTFVVAPDGTVGGVDWVTGNGEIGALGGPVVAGAMQPGRFAERR